jgi:hypothetical protein
MKPISTATLRKILLLLFLVMIGLDAYQTWRIAFVRHEADFPAYLAGAQGLLDRTNPYIPRTIAPYNNPPFNTPDTFRPFIYPLFIAWLWVPFALLPAIAASFTWFLLSVMLLIAILRQLATLFDIYDERQRLLFFGSLTLLFVSTIQAELMYGQMNLFVLFLLVLAVEYLEKNPIVSGFGFGAAISAKLMPIVLLPVIMLRNIRVSIVTILSVLVLAVLVPFLIMGTNLFDYYHYWFTSTLSGEITQGDHGYASFDLASVLAQLAGLSYPTTIMRIICGLVLISFPLILIRRGNNVAGFCLAFMLLPLTASRSEPAHLIILMPAMGFLLANMIKNGAKLWQWIGLLALQLMILWGFNKAIPFDTMGMLVLFGLVFMKGIQGKHPEIA